MNAGAGRSCPTKNGAQWGFGWTRPDSYWEVVVFHLPLALLSGVVLFVPRLVSLHSIPFIQCTFLRVTGYPCPFCGFTRSLWSISVSNWFDALNHCPLSLLGYGLLAILFAWNGTALLLGVRMKSGLYRLLKSPHPWWIFFVLLFSNWAYRIAFGKM